MCAQPRRWPIYATKRLVEIIPHLCAAGERHAVVANVVFHCFGSTNRTSERMSTYFKHSFLQTLNYVYSDRSYLEPPLSNANTEYARELVFTPLNRQLVKTVSPAIRPKPLSSLQANVEEVLSRFANHNTRAKEYVCVNGLYEAVGAKQFLKAMKLMRLDHKLRDEIHAKTINQYFAETLSENSEMAHIEVVDMALLLMQHRQANLYMPFVQGSWRPADVLDKVIKAEAKVAFDAFFAGAPQRIREQAYEMMRTTDNVTGLLKYPWGYIQMQNLMSMSTTDSVDDTVISPNNEHETMIGEDVVEPTHQALPHLVDAVADVVEPTHQALPHLVDAVADVVYCLKALKRYAHHQMGRGDALVAVHIEQDSVTIATMQSTFIIDMWVTDPLYQSALFNLLSWLWANARLVKIGHKIMPKIAKIAAKVDRPFTAFASIVDLANKRRKVDETNTNEGVVRFKPTGFSKSLNGLLQEYNLPCKRSNWNVAGRPICDGRAAHMGNMAKGMLSIEQQLREDGWMPTEFYDIDASENSPVCEQLEEEIQNAQL